MYNPASRAATYMYRRATCGVHQFHTLLRVVGSPKQTKEKANLRGLGHDLPLLIGRRRPLAWGRPTLVELLVYRVCSVFGPEAATQILALWVGPPIDAHQHCSGQLC